MSAIHRLIDFYRIQVHLMWTWRTGRRAFVRRVIVSLGIGLGPQPPTVPAEAA